MSYAFPAITYKMILLLPRCFKVGVIMIYAMHDKMFTFSYKHNSNVAIDIRCATFIGKHNALSKPGGKAGGNRPAS